MRPLSKLPLLSHSKIHTNPHSAPIRASAYALPFNLFSLKAGFQRTSEAPSGFHNPFYETLEGGSTLYVTHETKVFIKF